MSDLEIDKWWIESDRDRHSTLLRQLKRELREAREQGQTETRRLVKGDRRTP